jgi:3-oxoacyl-[acyl-carrier protein] reductase
MEGMTQPLKGKSAIVTGGSRGIGLAIATAFAAEGAHVAISGLAEGHLAAACQTIAAAGGGGLVEGIRADVRDHQDVERMVAQAVARFGGLDYLVNNAGIGIFSHIADMTPAQWAQTIDTNLTGVYNCCHAVIPHLRPRGGYIINISSLAGSNAFVGAAAYCASKAGLNAFSEALMQELRHENIRVSYVMPGSVATAFSGDEKKGADWKIAPADVAEVVLDLVRMHPRSLASRVEIRPSKPSK